jgi:hypothetical protein
MKKKELFRLFIFSLVLMTAFEGYTNRNEIVRWTAQSLLNHSTREFFENSARIKHAFLTHDLRLSLSELSAKLKTKNAPIPVEMARIESRDSLFNLLIGKTVRFDFTGVRPVRSQYRGLEGTAVFKAGSHWSFELESHVREMGLEDIEWVNPENLHGSTGKMIGLLRIKAAFDADPSFQLELGVKEPGGIIQAQFFDLLVPFLPQYESIEKIRSLSKESRLVGYQNARFQLDLSKSDKMKGFLHILIKEYNLDLNVNLEIRMDEKNAFLKLAQLLGLIDLEVALS